MKPAVTVTRQVDVLPDGDLAEDVLWVPNEGVSPRDSLHRTRDLGPWNGRAQAKGASPSWRLRGRRALQSGAVLSPPEVTGSQASERKV
jgi:hypothetical protein